MTLFIFPQPVEHQLCLLYSVYCQNNRGSKKCPNDWPFCLIYNFTNSHQNHLTKGSFWSQHVGVLHILILCQHINCMLLHKMICIKWPNIRMVFWATVSTSFFLLHSHSCICCSPAPVVPGAWYWYLEAPSSWISIITHWPALTFAFPFCCSNMGELSSSVFSAFDLEWIFLNR